MRPRCKGRGAFGKMVLVTYWGWHKLHMGLVATAYGPHGMFKLFRLGPGEAEEYKWHVYVFRRMAQVPYGLVARPGGPSWDYYRNGFGIAGVGFKVLALELRSYCGCPWQSLGQFAHVAVGVRPSRKTANTFRETHFTEI